MHWRGECSLRIWWWTRERKTTKQCEMRAQWVTNGVQRPRRVGAAGLEPLLRITLVSAALVASFVAPPGAAAQEHPEGQTEGVEFDEEMPNAPRVSAPVGDGGPTLEAKFGGYVETSFTWSFAEPDNGLIAYRGFDNRHATFSLENANLATHISFDRVYLKLSLQWGRTPDTYYLAEPSDSSGTAFGVGASSAATYRFIQEAYLGWNAPLLSGVAIEAGVFLSPVGIESIDVHSNWNWSRSNLFMGLPFYHLGLHVASALSENVSAHVAVYNGWNNILDNNVEKSVAGWVGFTSEDLSAQVLYFGGVEREGGNWRNLFDAWAAVEASPWLKLALHVDGGFEPYSGRDAGWWFGTAGYVRGTPTDWLALTLRQDVFLDRAPDDDPAARIFWATTPLMASTTITVQLIPLEYIAVFLEYRHDQTATSADLGGPAPDQDTFFRGAIPQDPATGAWVPNSRTQDTITLGVTAGL
ncbi:MAG: hypothetical protein DRJ42_03730 [Deltaproteobacteria bacterium]|nr:MAG: hypothetical protein DRJ42_03730 [Deltaproteobacteria bacterium]